MNALPDRLVLRLREVFAETAADDLSQGVGRRQRLGGCGTEDLWGKASTDYQALRTDQRSAFEVLDPPAAPALRAGPGSIRSGAYFGSSLAGSVGASFGGVALGTRMS
jgi:hypothetical protein